MKKDYLNKGNAYDLGDITKEKISGEKKAAVLLMTLGIELSSNILKKLSDKEVQRIGVEIANLHTVTAEDKRGILKEFLEIRNKNDMPLGGGLDYAETLLHGAFEDSRANRLIEGIKYDAYKKVFNSARKADVNKILACINGENPQTIAIILSYIQAEKSAQIMCKLDENLQREVAFKLGTIKNISPIVIKAVDSALEKKLSNIDSKKDYESGGFDSLIDILGKVDGKTEKNIINFLEATDDALAGKVKASMFVFEDIVKLDDLSIQKMLKEVKIKDVAISLKDVDEEISEKILKNQSKRAADALKEEINLLGTIKISQIEESKRNIVKVIRRLEQEGIITISQEVEEEVFV